MNALSVLPASLGEEVEQDVPLTDIWELAAVRSWQLMSCPRQEQAIFRAAAKLAGTLLVSQTYEGDRSIAIAHEFEELARQWENETALAAFASQKADHWAYQRIIELGEDALPLVIDRLEREPNHWFWALRAIVGTDVAVGERTVEGARVKWLKWAREQRLL